MIYFINHFKASALSENRAGRPRAADRTPVSGTGGTGITFDWTILEKFDRPYFLAGGLGPDNAADAVERLHPYAVDVSSGIETAGKKDPAKMAAFVAAVRKNDPSGKE